MTSEERAVTVFAACRERIDRGERVDFEEVIRAHPDLELRLRRKFDAMRRVERAGGAPDAVDAVPSPLVGRTLGPYRLEAVLGAGGMGTVYRAVSEEDGRAFAVKVVHAHLLARPGAFKRFLREAEIGRRVRHPNVVRTLDADAVALDGGQVHFLAMEYVRGQTLRELAQELGRVPEELCRHIGREVAKALGAIHAAGAVHRDLKPENVLISPDHVVKVMDLGVARGEDDALRASQTGAFVGSVRYAAPEQFEGRRGKVDGRADLYALGLTLYELATGSHPFDGDDFHAVLQRQLSEVPRPAGELNPQLSAFFEELLAQLLEKDRDARPDSAAAVAQILERGEESAWWKDRARAIRMETRRPPRRIRIPRETALYGRDAEIAKLRALFDAAKAGDGRVVLVEGEAGIGKSRLVDEFVGQLHAAGEDIDYLFGSYPPGGAATASGAFATAYREHFGGDEAAIREALPVTPLLVPAFAALLRGDATPEGAETLTKDSLQTVFVHATRSLAAGRPTIVLVDDLHFAPEEGRALFMSLALAVPGHRILLVGCSRPGLDAKWVAALARHAQTSLIPVPRLGPKELVRLLRDALRSERLAEELAALIAVKSDGNPFFVFELLRGLRDGQVLAQRPDGTWHTTQVIRDIQVPSSILDLVSARVADLASEERDLLDVAACCGFEFDPLVVGEAVGMARIPALKRLAQVERAHRLVRAAGSRYVFDHHQVQEALYGSLSEPLRAEYHAAIATALEARTGAASKEPKELDGPLCVDLADHLLRGGQGPRALRYLHPALGHLAANWSNDDFVRLTERALAVPGLLSGASRAEALLHLSNALDRLGRHAGQEACAHDAERLAEAAGDERLRVAAARGVGAALLRTARFEEAESALLRACELARSGGNRRAESAAVGSLGTVHWCLGRLAQAQEEFARSLALAREAGDPHFVGIATMALGVVLHSLGRHEDARQQFMLSLPLIREPEDRDREAQAHANLGAVLFALGRLAEARDHDERSLILSRETGNRPCESVATGNLGEVLGLLGCTAAARRHIERCLALARESGDRRQEGVALLSLAAVASEEGDTASAERLFAQSLDIRNSLGARSEAAEALFARGALRARQGAVDEALADLRAALATARHLALSSIELLASAHAAELARDGLGVALAALAAHGEHAGVSTLLEVRFRLWRASEDRSHLAEARRLLDSLVAHAPPEHRGTMLTNVRLHREIVEACERR